MDKILPQQEINDGLDKLDQAWTAIGNDYLVRVITTTDFDQGVQIVNDIAKIAKSQNHHPEITIGYHQVEVKVMSHSVQGITQRDIQFAAAVDALDVS